MNESNLPIPDRMGESKVVAKRWLKPDELDKAQQIAREHGVEAMQREGASRSRLYVEFVNMGPELSDEQKAALWDALKNEFPNQG